MTELISGITAVVTFAGVLGAWPYVVERFGRKRPSFGRKRRS